MTLTYQWIDSLWLIVAFLATHRDHRWWAVGFVASCMFIMRMEIELMEGINKSYGILNLMQSHVHNRLLVVYSIVYILYFLMAYYSKDTRGSIFLAASISIFFLALVSSIFVMVL